MKHAFVVSILFGSFQWALAQEIPFLSQEEYDWIVNEISGDSAFEHIRYFTHFHRPRGGTPGLMKVAEYVEEKARGYGLERVRRIRQDYSLPSWTNHSAELWLVEPVRQRLASTTQVAIHLADNSRTTHIETAELVWVGEGSHREDYLEKEVQGKIVVAYGPHSQVMREAVWQRGALGLIHYPDPTQAGYPHNSLLHPDQIHWGRIPIDDGQGRAGTFAFQISARQAVELIRLLQSGQRVSARVEIESEWSDESWQVLVEGFLPGTEVQDQDIVLTAHLQEEKFSANDDASGCASMLEIARALGKLIREGKIQRPRRNLRFWWVTEISGPRQYFADHPEAARSMLVNLNQDMVGAHQGQDLLRTQNMTRLPFARFHFVNDVAERILEFVVESNRANLAVLQAGTSPLYPRPIVARLGTQQRFHAEIIPFHNSTDHMTFNEAPIGVPGITFTNWPDHYIHTSDDDLWNIDRTQLQRNAFAVAAIAYVLGRAGGKHFDLFLSEATGRALQRMAEDLRLALAWISAGAGGFYPALHQLEEAVGRELRSLASLEILAEEPAQKRRLEAAARKLEQVHATHRELLGEHQRSLHGEPPREELTETEAQLEQITPRLVAGPREFLERRSRVSEVAGLHSLMAFEVLNFIDGRRTGLQIYRAVAAEARRAGSHYYGEVRPEMVRDYLQNLKAAELVTF